MGGDEVGHLGGPGPCILRRPVAGHAVEPDDAGACLVDGAVGQREVLRTTVLEVDGMAAGEDDRIVEGIVGGPDLHVRDVGGVSDADGVIEQDAGHIGQGELLQKPPLAPAPRLRQHLGPQRADERPVGTLGIEKGALARVLEDLAHVALPTRDSTRPIERLR
jgi:hypothetical protein